MPALTPSSNEKILVTGANGYIAMWVVKALLDEGFSVRGTIRSQQKADQLAEYFDEKTYGNRVEWVVVPDIQKIDAFDKAVKGVDGILHTASPLPEASDDPEDLIKPAVEGTLNILQSAWKHGEQVRRIVITSSVATIIGELGEGTAIFNETHWNDHSIEDVQEQGKNAPAIVKYRASKTLAEKAAWAFYQTHKSQIPFDIVTIHPPYVLGPPLQNLKTPQELGSSMTTWYKNVMLDSPDEALTKSYAYIDVRDVALAHVKALEKPEASGERLIVSEGATTFQETRKLIHELRPDLLDSGVVPKGNADLKKHILFDYDPKKGKAILGMKYRSLKDIVIDMLDDFKNRGWLAPNKNAPAVEN